MTGKVGSTGIRPPGTLGPPGVAMPTPQAPRRMESSPTGLSGMQPRAASPNGMAPRATLPGAKGLPGAKPSEQPPLMEAKPDPGQFNPAAARSRIGINSGRLLPTEVKERSNSLDGIAKLKTAGQKIG